MYDMKNCGWQNKG